jgi:hypothetical protein
VAALDRRSADWASSVTVISQTMFHNIPVPEKRPRWMEGSAARRDDYAEFQHRAQPVLGWSGQYVS